jgi:hypothetical protein
VPTNSASLTVTSAVPSWSPTPWLARYSIASITPRDAMLRVAYAVAVERPIEPSRPPPRRAQAHAAKARKSPKLSISTYAPAQTAAPAGEASAFSICAGLLVTVANSRPPAAPIATRRASRRPSSPRPQRRADPACIRSRCCSFRIADPSNVRRVGAAVVGGAAGLRIGRTADLSAAADRPRGR